MKVPQSVVATGVQYHAAGLPEHQVHFLYPFRLAWELEQPCDFLKTYEKKLSRCTTSRLSRDLAGCSLFTATDNTCDPAWQTFEHAQGEAESGQKEDGKFFLPSADFVPHIAALAAGRSHQGRRIVQHWRLAETLMSRLENWDIPVPFNVQALRRLDTKAADLLYCRVNAVFLSIFSSGIGLVQISVRYELSKTHDETQTPDPFDLIAEANYALCHRKETYSSPVNRLAEVVLGSFGAKDLAIHRRRSFTFTGIALDESPIDIEGMAANLSLKTHAGYSPGGQFDDACTVWRASQEIVHAVSNDGGAIIVCDRNKSDFIKNFLNRNFNSYLALARLALHENHAITQLGLRLAALSDLKTLRSGEYLMLTDISRRLYQYRLNYRFTIVSEEPRHNHVHHLWRKTLHMEALEKEVTDDVAKVIAFVQVHRFAHWKLLLKSCSLLAGIVGVAFSADSMFELGGKALLSRWVTTFCHGPTLEWIRAHPMAMTGAALAAATCGVWSMLAPGRRPRTTQDGQ
jgi:hypothetical protein